MVMKCCRLLLAAVLPIAFAVPVQAGLFSFGKPKVTEMPAAKTTAVAPTRTGFWPFSSIKSAVSSQPVTPARAVTTETAPPPLAQPEPSATQPPPAVRSPAQPKVVPSAASSLQKPPAQSDTGPDLPPQ